MTDKESAYEQTYQEYLAVVGWFLADSLQPAGEQADQSV